MEKHGLTVSQVMDWLNCTKSYVYFLLRNGVLEAEDASSQEMRISRQSIIKKIGNTYPKLVSRLYSALDYQLSVKS